VTGLLTDLYELTMSAGYFEAGKTDETAPFEIAIRQLPPHRNFVLAAGLPQIVEYLLNLSFTAEEIDYLMRSVKKLFPQARISAQDIVYSFAGIRPLTAGKEPALGAMTTANTGRGFIVLKPRDERELTASQIIDRLRPQLAKVQGATLFLQPTQDITMGGRIARASFQYTLQDSNVAELNEWSGKLLEQMRTLPQLADVSSDLLANAPQLKVTINRDQASRFGISAQTIDDTLNDAFGQRQIAQYFTQLKTYWIILEIPPEQQRDLTSLDRLYVKSPLTGGAVPLSTLVDVDTSKVGPLSIAHQGQFPAVTLSFNLQPGVALGEAVEAVTQAAGDKSYPVSRDCPPSRAESQFAGTLAIHLPLTSGKAVCTGPLPCKAQPGDPSTGVPVQDDQCGGGLCNAGCTGLACSGGHTPDNSCIDSKGGISQFCCSNDTTKPSSR